MTFTPQEIDRIVAQVLEQLQPPAPRVSSPAVGTGTRHVVEVPKLQSAAAPAVPIPVKLNKPEESTPELSLEDAIITGDLLLTRLGAQKTIRVRSNAVLTPSAKDVLRVRQLEVVRGGKVAAGDVVKALWLAISSRMAASVPGVIDQLKSSGEQWGHRLSGTGTEATRQAVTALCTAEAAGVVVLTGEPETAACLANRNLKIRAAVADTVEGINRVRKSLQPNLLAIDPAGKSFFELRNLFRTFSASRPEVPAGWSEM